ncbi:hypothetical protein HCJ76_44215 [Streptomyces sp. MC1]|uniref:hypothetical protein n=1 Tax=Streptomyces sp. MC1 TaxID=295105 RepID=UPI0018C8E73C|nr:hypothetical protein [Streptomyces sp. MC1]MBG7704890.1 hypothetical protein [Streptomyces sp. MC1]
MSATVAEHVNRLPYETWVDAEEMSRLINLPPAEVAKVVRKARRVGSVTVRTDDGLLQYKRIRRHPLPSRRLAVAMA